MYVDIQMSTITRKRDNDGNYEVDGNGEIIEEVEAGPQQKMLIGKARAGGPRPASAAGSPQAPLSESLYCGTCCAR